MGAKEETFHGLAGVGDLITTCVSPEGRNRTVGEQIGKGKKLQDVLGAMDSVAEGVPTTRAVRELARRCDVDMPITEAVHAVLFEDKDVLDVVIIAQYQRMCHYGICGFGTAKGSNEEGYLFQKLSLM